MLPRTNQNFDSHKKQTGLSCCACFVDIHRLAIQSPSLFESVIFSFYHTSVYPFGLQSRLLSTCDCSRSEILPSMLKL